MPPPTIGERVGHTITCTGKSGSYIVVGGRSSPSNAVAECWLLKNGEWSVADPLPLGYIAIALQHYPFTKDLLTGQETRLILSVCWYTVAKPEPITYPTNGLYGRKVQTKTGIQHRSGIPFMLKEKF